MPNVRVIPLKFRRTRKQKQHLKSMLGWAWDSPELRQLASQHVIKRLDFRKIHKQERDERWYDAQEAWLTAHYALQEALRRRIMEYKKLHA